MTKGLRTLWCGVLAALVLALPALAQAPQDSDLSSGSQKNRKTYAQLSLSHLLPAAVNDLKAPNRAAGEVVDEHGIITQPAEGELKTYERTGQGMLGEDYGDGMFLYYEEQDGTIEVVECSDGTVYFKDLIYGYQRGYWVKGTKIGNTISVAANQPLYYSEEYNASITLRWAHGMGDGTIEPADSHADGFTFTIGDDGSLTLEGTTEFNQGAENYFIGLFWSDNNEYAIYGDALTVYKPINIVTQVDVLPYVNGFTTMGDQRSFTIVDGNEDNSTWYAFDGKFSHFGSYDYDADDWLISPAIKLEAGKNYYVAFDTWKNTDEAEKTIELKMGRDASPAALTQDAIAAVAVESLGAVTMENDRLTVDETGYYYFGIHDISEAGGYSLYVDNFIIEEGAANNAPAAITDLQVVQAADALKATVSFTAPDKAFDGSALTTNLTKVEVLRDGVVVNTLEDLVPGSAQQFEDEGMTIGNHTYTAIAYNENGKGQKSPTITVFFFEAQDIPYTVVFDDPSVLNVLNIIDANDDGNTWEWNGYNNALIYPPSYNADADDYLVVMPVRAEAGRNYKVTFTAHTGYAAERFEVLAGRQGTPDALTMTVIPATAFQADDATDFEGSFTANESGLYFVAIHCISDMYAYDLFVDKLVIEKGAEPTAPAAVSDLAVVPGELGAKLANVTFTAPSKAIDGTALTENLTKIELLCDGVVVETVENVEPGAAVEIITTVETPNYYTYQVIAYNASGAGLPSDKVKVWIGQDAPGNFYGVQATDNGTSVEFSWPMVTEGANGNYLNPDDVEYQILATEFNGWSYDFTDVLGSVTGADHYTLEFNTDEGEQQFTTWGVKPVNEAGEGYPLSVTLLTGAPYGLPFEESFADGGDSHLWEKDSDASLYIVDQASDDDGYGLAMTTTWFTGDFALTSGKLALQGASNPVLYFDVKSSGVETLLVMGSELAGEPILLHEVTLSNEWNTIRIPLNDIKDARYSRLAFIASFFNPSSEDWMSGTITSWGDAVFFDNIRIIDEDNTGIVSVQSDEATTQSGIFTIDGRRVSSTSDLKGFYIVNGKKIYIK
ncbi:MAG: hypothetical protein IJV05_09035 [Muribaculaceae bacterium]|nr:hypothetical protein [Muribaculaceae bacterium]